MHVSTPPPSSCYSIAYNNMHDAVYPGKADPSAGTIATASKAFDPHELKLDVIVR